MTVFEFKLFLNEQSPKLTSYIHSELTYRLSSEILGWQCLPMRMNHILSTKFWVDSAYLCVWIIFWVRNFGLTVPTYAYESYSFFICFYRHFMLSFLLCAFLCCHFICRHILLNNFYVATGHSIIYDIIIKIISPFKFIFAKAA